MPNIELLEKSMPVAPIRIAAWPRRLTKSWLNSVKNL